MTSAQLENAIEIGTRIREAREARGVSQDKLAGFVGTIPSVIEKLENGEVLFPLMVVEMATVLGVTPAWLMWGDLYSPVWVDYCQITKSAE